MSTTDEAVRAAIQKAEAIRAGRRDFRPLRVSEEDQVHLMVLASALASSRRDVLEEAAVEAEKPRIMLLTHDQIADGILSDDHPVIRARKQMRTEIAAALRGMQ